MRPKTTKTAEFDLQILAKFNPQLAQAAARSAVPDAAAGVVLAGWDWLSDNQWPMCVIAVEPSGGPAR